MVFLDKTVCYCSTMNRIDLPHLVWALESLVAGQLVNQITVDDDTASQAQGRLEQMLALPLTADAAAWAAGHPSAGASQALRTDRGLRTNSRRATGPAHPRSASSGRGPARS